jgi:D-alanyl-D-alanine carboxypeptidase
MVSACNPSPQTRVLPANTRLERKLAALVERQDEVALQYIAVSDSQTLFEYSGGLLDAASGARVTSQTQFMSASSTKILTAAAVLKLLEMGALQLTDPVSRYVPEQPYAQKVTIAQLVNHSSGVPNPLPLRWVHTDKEHASYDEHARLHAELARHPELDFEPGAKYSYSNLGYWLLGAVIEAASHTSYAAFIQHQLLEPLAISERDMSFELKNPAQVARGHLARWSLLGLIVPLMADSKILARAHGKWLRFEHLHMNGLAYGGLRATAGGYARFLQDLLQERSRVLGPGAKQLLFSAQQDTRGRALPTTLGFHMGELDGVPYFSKPGGGPGFNSNLRIYPSRRLATVYLSNQMRASEASIQHFSDDLDREILAAPPTATSS